MAVSLPLCATAFASVVPTWRGDDGSTWQQWDFSSNSTSPSPDAGSNPYGDPILTVNPIGGWIENPPGAWPLSGEIDIFIPNRPETAERKEIWLQLLWQAGSNQTPTLPDEPWVAVTPFSSTHMSRQDTVLDGWTQSLFEITIWPNPPYEWITVKGDIIVDQLIIDTICIPEPATIFLLGMGGLMTLRGARKRGLIQSAAVLLKRQEHKR